MGDVQWRMCYLTQLGIVHRLVLLGFMSVIVLVLKCTHYVTFNKSIKEIVN